MAGPIPFEELTGQELRDIRNVVGMPLGKVAQDGDVFELAYALEWIARRRDDPKVTFDDVLELDVGDVLANLEAPDKADPTQSQSGSESPHSATSGA